VAVAERGYPPVYLFLPFGAREAPVSGGRPWLRVPFGGNL